MKEVEANSATANLHFWNNSPAAILLLVVFCEGLMEALSHLASNHISVMAAHALAFLVVTSVGTIIGSWMLISQTTIRDRLVDEVAARKLAQEQLAKFTGELRDALAEVESHNQRLLTFGEFAHALLSCRAECDLYECMTKYATALFPGSIGAIYSSELGGWRLACSWPSGSGLPPRVRPEASPDNPPAVANAVLISLRKGAGSRQSLAIPVVVGKELIAVIYIEFAPNEQSPIASRVPFMFKAVCEGISLAFANLRLRSELGQQVVRDPLTGLFNRRYMEEALAREVKRAERHSLQLSVMMIDLDHFKQLNDQFGHACGDAVLRGLGGTILTHSREEDIACRYGGEEILLVLPNTGARGAIVKGQQLRSKIKKLASLVEYRCEVTASIGVASYPRDGLTVAALVKSADSAMYTAKRLGRNRVCDTSENPGRREEFSGQLSHVRMPN